MAILAIAAVLVAPQMSSFFRGRALDLEAQRLLSLIHYGQTRAVSEGVPILLWVNARESSYGLSIQPGFVDTDNRASTFTLDPSLTIEATPADASIVSEQQDERLGLPTDLPVIRFTPDGLIDPVSVSRILIRQGTEAALQFVPTADRLGYQIQPAHADGTP